MESSTSRIVISEVNQKKVCANDSGGMNVDENFEMRDLWPITSDVSVMFQAIGNLQLMGTVSVRTKEWRGGE